MNFQDLSKVENASFYLDVAFRKARKLQPKGVAKKSTYLEKTRRICLEKIQAISNSLVNHLQKIITSYPNIDNLPEFYVELIKTQLEYVDLKKSLGAVDWAAKKIMDFTKVYSSKITRSSEVNVVNKHLKEYFGRVSSLMKRIDKNLAYLEECRRTMKSFPSVKTSLFTVALYGFPNVGKTTVLSKLTDSKAEINSYAFTTKTINSGTIKDVHGKIQILDTPGTLNRLEKMNEIEMQADLAIKYCADVIVYVLDLTEGYPLNKQMELLKKVEKKYSRRKKFLVYLSKTDLLDKIPKLDFEYLSDVKILKEKIIELSLDN